MGKTASLLLALTTLAALAGQALGGHNGLLLALAAVLSAICVAYCFASRLALALSGARALPFEEAPDLHRLLGQLATQAGLPSPHLWLIEHETPNACASGRRPDRATLVVTRGLLQTLSRDELAGALAHELAHVRNGDIMLTSLVAALAAGLMAVGGWRSEQFSGGFQHLLVPLAAALVRLTLSPTGDYRADSVGAQILGDPLPLARALEKLETANRANPLPVNPGLAHLFTVAPLAGAGLQGLFHAHPPSKARVARLREMALQPTWPEGAPGYL